MIELATPSAAAVINALATMLTVPVSIGIPFSLIVALVLFQMVSLRILSRKS